MTLKEIDWELDMLHKYLEYRIALLAANHKEITNIMRMYEEQGVIIIGYSWLPTILSFQYWLHRYKMDYIFMHGEPIKFD